MHNQYIEYKKYKHSLSSNSNDTILMIKFEMLIDIKVKFIY